MLNLVLYNTFDPESIEPARIDCSDVQAAADAFETWSGEWDGEIAAELSDAQGNALTAALQVEIEARQRENWVEANPDWHAEMLADNAEKLAKGG